MSVPGSNTRFHEKAASAPADEIFFDLEDSVAPAAKERARQLVVDALRRFDFGGKTRAVRVNACDTKWCYGDVIAVVEGAGDRLDCVIVPKVEGPGHVHFIDTLIAQIESKMGWPRRIGLELQIESARGLEDADAICQASERSETLIFGPADFSVSLGFPELRVGGLRHDYPGDFWHYFLARIVVAARANGMQPIDGPYGQVRDLDGLREFARRAAMLGFDGKWALGPAQAEVLNEIFAPSQEDFDKATAIVEAYRQATDVEETGAVMLGDEMIDEASRKMAAALVVRGRAFGMRAHDWQPATKR